MAITASEARADLFGLIEQVNLDHTEVEITSKRGSAVLMSQGRIRLARSRPRTCCAHPRTRGADESDRQRRAPARSVEHDLHDR